MKNWKNKNHQPNFKLNVWIALIPVVFMIVGIISNAFISPEHSYPQLWLMSGGMIALFLAYLTGKKWDDSYSGLKEFLKIAWFPIFFVITIGVLITVWKINGLIPSIIYYTSEILRPQFVIPGAFVAVAIFSILSGSSWGGFATIGAIIIAITDVTFHNRTLTIITSGAVLSGAYLGDRISPISGTTIYCATNSDVDIMEHVKKSLPVVITVTVITFFIYLGIGFSFSKVDPSFANEITVMKGLLKSKIIISGWLILPLLLFIPLLWLRINMLTLLWICIGFGILIFFIVQRGNFWDFLSIMSDGQVVKSVDPGASKAVVNGANAILSSSGIKGSLSTVFFLICSLFFAGSLKILGTLDILIAKIAKLVKGPKSLILVSGLSGALFPFVSSDQSVGCNVNPTFYTKLYDKLKVNKLNLSTSTDNTSTMIVPLTPWSSDKAAFVGKALNGTSLSNIGSAGYVVIGFFAFLNWLTPVVATIFVLLDLFQLDINGKMKFYGGIKSYVHITKDIYIKSKRSDKDV